MRLQIPNSIDVLESQEIQNEDNLGSSYETTGDCCKFALWGGSSPWDSYLSVYLVSRGTDVPLLQTTFPKMFIK